MQTPGRFTLHPAVLEESLPSSATKASNSAWSCDRSGQSQLATIAIDLLSVFRIRRHGADPFKWRPNGPLLDRSIRSTSETSTRTVRTALRTTMVRSSRCSEMSEHRTHQTIVTGSTNSADTWGDTSTARAAEIRTAGNRDEAAHRILTAARGRDVIVSTPTVSPTTAAVRSEFPLMSFHHRCRRVLIRRPPSPHRLQQRIRALEGDRQG